jgi:hypothetical protein
LSRNGILVGTTRFDLKANSFFIHGNKSQVQFDYPGKICAPVELGDIIFICTLVVSDKRYFERLTISQFKLDNNTKRVLSWTIDNDKQLYLLSHFPKFICVKGILHREDYVLANNSGCLGSYGLIQRPGDLVFISGTLLDALLARKRTIKKPDMYGKSTEHQQPFLYGWPGNWMANCHLCLDTDNFANNYLSLNIGEPTVAAFSIYNQQAREILGDLASSLGAKAKKTALDAGVSHFIDSFSQFPYEDGYGRKLEQDNFQDRTYPSDSDEGTAVVHTTIRLVE